MPGLRRLPEVVLIHEAKGTRTSAALEASFQPVIFMLASVPATTAAAENDQGHGMHKLGVLRSGPGRLRVERATRDVDPAHRHLDAVDLTGAQINFGLLVLDEVDVPATGQASRLTSCRA